MSRRMPQPLPSETSVDSRSRDSTGLRLKENAAPVYAARTSPPPLIPVAQQLLDAGRVDVAIQLLERDIARGNDSAAHQVLIARAAFRAGNLGRSQQALRHAASRSIATTEIGQWLDVIVEGENQPHDASLDGEITSRWQESKAPPAMQTPSRSQTMRMTDDDEDVPTTRLIVSRGRGTGR